MRIQKKTILLLILLFTLINLKAAQNNLEITSDSVSLLVTPSINFTLPDSVINYGKLFLKTPYRYGSTGTNSFDCSGFTSYVYRNFGYNLERSSSDQAEQFPSIERNQIKTGDLVFFEGRRRNGHVGHVGIVVATNDSGHFDFIHAAVRSGVTISNSKEAYYVKRFVKAGRIIGSDTTARIKGVIPKMRRDEYVSLEPANSVKVTIPAKYHKVKKGENLSTIAEKYGLTVTALKRKNHLKKNSISINQRLKIKEEESYTKAETILAEKTESSVINSETSDKSPENQPILTENTTPLTKSHTVKKGETLHVIAKQYNTTVSDIKNLNNLNNNNISIGQELKLAANRTELAMKDNNEIKTKTSESITNNKQITHKVKRGESLFLISKNYNVSVEDLKKLNQLSGNKIAPGQILIIVGENASLQLANNNAETKIQSENSTENKTETKKHKIRKGESLFTIAKLYNMSVDELKLMNQLTNTKLQQGQLLIVSQTDSRPEKSKGKPVKIHRVKSGESFYSIAKTYGCTVSELKSLNGLAENKLNIGDKLKVNDRN